MILSQTCETKLRYGHQSTNALPAFSTGLPHELYVKKGTTHPSFFPIPRLYPRLPNSAARPSWTLSKHLPIPARDYRKYLCIAQGT